MIISITGAGGKTTLMFKLAEELRNEYKVLVATTTKIYLPQKEQYDFIAFDHDNINQLNKSCKKGIYVYGTSVNEENKIIGLTPGFLDSCVKFFDHVIIESDGAKRKLIKGWNSTEPVIIHSTTHTLGVLNTGALGLKVNNTNVHRLEEFIRLTGASQDEAININHLLRLILSPDGLFKNSKGKRILCLVGENNELLESIQNETSGFIDEIRCLR